VKFSKDSKVHSPDNKEEEDIHVEAEFSLTIPEEDDQTQNKSQFP
jgi:hypothetical protein